MMEMVEKWTVRMVPMDCMDKLREVRETSRVPYGMLIAEAVSEWYGSLPVAEQRP